MSGSKLKSNNNSHHISRATNNLTNQKYSSNTISVCKKEQASSSSLLNLSLIGSSEDEGLTSKVAESKERQEHCLSLSSHLSEKQEVLVTKVENNVERQSELIVNNNHDISQSGSRSSLNGTQYETLTMSQPQPQPQSLPFMFQRPKAFHKKNGSFGSQINLASRNASAERSLKDFSENSSSQLYNKSEIFSQEMKCENISTEEHSSQSISHLHSQSFNEIISEQETCQNQNISQEISQIHKFSTESDQIDSEVSEGRDSVSELKEGTFKPRYNNSDSFPEHYRAQCRYETSQNTAEPIMETDSHDIKEFNIEAKIVIRPSRCEIQNSTSSSVKCESEAVDQISRQEGKQQFIKELKNSSDVEEVQEIEQETENIGKDPYINPHQKDIIKSCIEELEKLAEFDHDQEPPTEIDKYISASAQNARQDVELEEYEEVQFSTEEIIDSEDLEHIHVVNTKSEQRRLSTQFENIQLKEVIEAHFTQNEVVEQTNRHTEAKDQTHTFEVEDDTATSEIMQDFEESINKTVEINTTTERMEDFEETINHISESYYGENHQFEETEIHNAEIQESILSSSKIQEFEETKTQTTEIQESSQEELEETKNETVDEQRSFFLTEMDDRTQSKLQCKRERNRTIDYHSLPSLYWEASVQNYHERQYVETEKKTDPEDQLPEDDKGGIDLAKDGLSLILKK